MQIIIFPGTEIAIGNELLKKRLLKEAEAKNKLKLVF